MTGPVFHTPTPNPCADYQQRVLDKLQQAIQMIEPAVHASNTNLGFWIGLTKAFDIVKGVKP